MTCSYQQNYKNKKTIDPDARQKQSNVLKERPLGAAPVLVTAAVTAPIVADGAAPLIPF